MNVVDFTGRAKPGLPDCVTGHPRFVPDRLGGVGGRIGDIEFRIVEHRVTADGSAYVDFESYEDQRLDDDPGWDDLTVRHYVIVRGGGFDYARVEMAHIEAVAWLLIGGDAA